jgi:hypothetical protein
MSMKNRFYNRTVLAWFDFFDVRAQWVPSLYSHAAAYGRCSAVLRSPLRVPVLHGDFSVADSTRGPVACESLRAFGTDDSGSHHLQHFVHPHFHGPRRSPASCRRHGFMVSCDFEGAVRVYGDPSTLRNPGKNKAKPKGDKPMSYSISTLLTRNLQDVFGENDPTRRRAAIDEIWTEDGVFYDPNSSAHHGRDEIDRVAGEIRGIHPDFRYQPIAPPEELGDGGRICE